jgi:hypothetical protein
MGNMIRITLNQATMARNVIETVGSRNPTLEFVFIHSHQPVVGNSGRSRLLDSSWLDLSRET